MSTERERCEATCKQIGRLLAASIPPGIGFFLSVFSFDPTDQWSTYMSNGHRADMVKFLRELAARLEGE